jgi:hypothetical protein
MAVCDLYSVLLGGGDDLDSKGDLHSSQLSQKYEEK